MYFLIFMVIHRSKIYFVMVPNIKSIPPIFIKQEHWLNLWQKRMKFLAMKTLFLQ